MCIRDSASAAHETVLDHECAIAIVRGSLDAFSRTGHATRLFALAERSAAA